MKTIPPTIDQGRLDNCKAHALGYGHKSRFGFDFDVNWLMGIGTQKGIGINHMLDALLELGALPVGDYSIEPAHVVIAKEWVQQCGNAYKHIAAKYKIKEYRKITSVDELLAAINDDNWHVVFTVVIPLTQAGYPVDSDGIFRPHLAYNPANTHAMSAWRVNSDGTVRVLNSWGTQWGDNGQANMIPEDMIRVDHCFAYRFDTSSMRPISEPEKPKGEIMLRENKVVGGLPTDTTNAIVRIGKELNTDQIGRLRNGDEIILLAEEGTRAMIAIGLVGWMDKKYIKDQPIQTPKPPFTPASPGVHTYTDKQKDLRLTENFTVGDFWAYPNHKSIKLDTELAIILEKVYAHFGVRPYMRNRNLGTSKPYEPQSTAAFRDSSNWSGNKTSQHCYGKGLDFYVPGLPAYRLAQFVETIPTIGGIGLYLKKSGELEAVKHIHIDTRSGSRAHWGWNGETSGTNTPGFGGIKCTFRKGNKSAAIEEIQITLNKLKYNCGTPDGHWGDNTTKAFKAWQKANNLSVDGVYGSDSNKIMKLFNWST